MTSWDGVTAISLPTLDNVAGNVRQTDSFLTAQRHSRLVRLLRIAVPASAAASVAIVLIGWWLSTARAPDLAITDVSITAEGIAMDAPVLRGEDNDGRPYELRAAQAVQSLSANPVISLQMLEGEIALDNDELARLTAPQARYDRETQTVAFEQGDLTIRITSGAEIRLGVTVVDLEKGTLSSEEAVRIFNNEVQLDAGALYGFDGGERLLFTDGVQMVFTPAQNGTD